MKKRYPLKCSQQWTPAQKCRVWCERLKKPCHWIWSITLSGGRLGAEGTCNFRWSDGIGLPHTFYPATQALPHTAPPAPNDHQSPPNEGAHFASAFFPSPTVLLIMEEEKTLNFARWSFSIWIPLPHESPLFEYCDCNIDTSSSPPVEFTEFWKWSLIFYDDRGFSSISHGIWK